MLQQVAPVVEPTRETAPFKGKLPSRLEGQRLKVTLKVRQVTVLDPSLSILLAEVRRQAGVCGAGATADTGDGGVLVQGIVRIQPQHVGLLIIPKRHHQHHTPVQSLSHGLQATLPSEVVDVPKGRLHVRADLVGDRIARHPGQRHVGVRDDFAILHIESADVDEVPIICVALSDELGDNGHLLPGVQLKVLAPAIEVPGTETIGVEITAILVADTIVALLLGVVATVYPLANIDSGEGARVGRVGRGLAIGLPNVHLGAASSPLPDGRGMAGVPPHDIGLALHELHIVRALRVAVSGAILGTRLAMWIDVCAPLGAGTTNDSKGRELFFTFESAL